jgi:hypothetical protein
MIPPITPPPINPYTVNPNAANPIIPKTAKPIAAPIALRSFC